MKVSILVCVMMLCVTWFHYCNFCFFVKDFVIVVLHEFVLRRIMTIVIDGLSCAHFVFVFVIMSA